MTKEAPSPTGESPPTRDELVEMVARAHKGSGYADAQAAGRALAGQSKLPRVIAENLGAGFGQWSFFPEPTEIVDFALAYAAPATSEDVWALARTWASDDAAARPTLMTLVGREIVQHELRRIEVPALREVVDEIRPTRARALREAAGLAVAAAPQAKAEPKRKAAAAPAPRAQAAAPASTATSAGPAAPAPAAKTVAAAGRMPKPELKRPVKAAPGPPRKRFVHPKFGEGVLESQDGTGDEAKLTITFESGKKTLQARYVTEVPV